MSIHLRPAVEADLPQVTDIYYRDAVGDDPRPPAWADAAIFRHALHSGRLVIAEGAGGGPLVGYAAALDRGGVAFLSDLFVRPGHQSDRVGQALLRLILPDETTPCFTLASSDPRGQSLYIRRGMQPLWPVYSLRAESVKLAELPAADPVEIAPANDLPALGLWDDRLSRRSREADRAFWLDQSRAAAVLFRRGSREVGYGFLQRRSPESVYFPTALNLGPQGAATPDDALACVVASVRWAAAQAGVLRINLPGPHPALAPLLRAGFRIGSIYTYCATPNVDSVDPRCYVPQGGEHF